MVAWVAYGSPRVALYFPVLLLGNLPSAYGEGRADAPSIQDLTLELETHVRGNDKRLARLEPVLERLQAKFDHDAEAFLTRAREGQRPGSSPALRQQAGDMMQEHVALFERECEAFLGHDSRPMRPPAPAEEMLFYA